MTVSVALITGAARRIGSTISEHLHRAGYNVVLHYHKSEEEAQALSKRFNAVRPQSSVCLQADLRDLDAIKTLGRQAAEHWQGLDLLVNNASSFYPTAVEDINQEHWHDLLGTNLQAPLFLSKACANSLRARKGCIINMADIHGERPLSGHTVYCVAKAGNIMLTKSLAKELAPDIRVNGIAPGAILWPENDAALDDAARRTILNRTALKRIGNPDDIAKAITFLAMDAPYITGQILAVDGGRNLVS